MSSLGLYNLSHLNGSRILITGASGWLGQETLCLLNNIYPGFRNISLTLAGSKKRLLQIHGHSLNIIPLAETSRSNSYDYIFHFAFETQDKVKELGFDEYILRNSELNGWISDIAANNPLAKNLILSSGAVSQFSTPNKPTTPMEIYANLKQNLESRFVESNSLILRLWNTSGHHMGSNPNYALSEFVNRAMNSETITVGKNLGRSYVGASAVLQASISYLLSGGYGVVNSGGVNIRLLELARTVVQALESKSKIELVDNADYPQFDYLSPKTEIPEEFWGENPNMFEQVINTAEYFNQIRFFR